jgi:acyl carrier protein
MYDITVANALVRDAILSCSLPSQDVDGRSYNPECEQDTPFETLGFDSLCYMEFCIALHCSTGLELSMDAVAELGTPGAVARLLTQSADTG